LASKGNLLSFANPSYIYFVLLESGFLFSAASLKVKQWKAMLIKNKKFKVAETTSFLSGAQRTPNRKKGIKEPSLKLKNSKETY
jgi:hypothetical protein